MKASTLQTIDKGKHGLYLFSIGVLFFLTALAFLHAPASTIHMDFLAAVMPRWALTLLVLALAVVLAFVLLFFLPKTDLPAGENPDTGGGHSGSAWHCAAIRAAFYFSGHAAL